MNSKPSNVTSITDMQDEAIRLIDLQKEIFEKIRDSKHLASKKSVKKDSDQSFEFFTPAAIQTKLDILEDNKTKTKNLEMVLAVVGTMKAGKSTTINAIVGREILPNRNRPMTALPTRIRHVNGCKSPVLRFEKHGPIKELIAKLKQVKPADIGKEINNDENLKKAFASLKEKQTLADEHHGEKEIFEFLAYLNDLVRLSAALGVDFPFEQYTSIDDFPLIEVEFFSLRDLDHSGIGRFTILDTPGFNEHGQQEKLQPMVWEQLKKATAVLAVLDYTQLKSTSEGVLRAELNETAKLSKGRMFALVNKFDQEDRNSSSAEETRKYVAEHLLAEAEIKPEYIFPTSSRNAYLAKQAQLAQTQLQGIFWAESEQKTENQSKSWIEDFAELAFGKRWQKFINDSDEVKEAAEGIWKDSRFDKLLQDVVQHGYLSAAHIAIDAATDVLKANAELAKSFIDGRIQMLSRDDKELRKAVNEVNSQIESLNALQKKSEKDLKKRIQALNAQVEQGIEDATQQANTAISDFLKKGAVNIAAVLRGELDEELKHLKFYKTSSSLERENILQNLLDTLPPNLKRSQTILAQLRGNKYKTLDEIKLFFSSPKTDPERKKRDGSTALVWPRHGIYQEEQDTDESGVQVFDPEMVYESKDEAEKALAEIGRQVSGILKSTQTSVRQQLEKSRDTWEENMQSLHIEIAEQVKNFSKDASDLGLSALSFSIPDLPRLYISENQDITAIDFIEDQSRQVRRRHEQDSVFGSIKRSLDFFNQNWGYDEYSTVENKFVINRKAMKSHWAGLVKQSLASLNSAVKDDFSTPIQESSEEFFRSITDHFEEIAENLQGGLENHAQSLDTQSEIKQELQLLKKLNHPSLQDLETLSAAVKFQTNELKQTTTTGRGEWVN